MPNEVISLDRARPHVEAISGDAQMHLTKETEKINFFSFVSAMQAGYRMACEDNGIPVPEMADPAKILEA